MYFKIISKLLMLYNECKCCKNSCYMHYVRKSGKESQYIFKTNIILKKYFDSIIGCRYKCGAHGYEGLVEQKM